MSPLCDKKADIRVSESLISEAKELSAISAASMTSAWSHSDFCDAIEGAHALCLSAYHKDALAGYVIMYHAADEGEIPSVAVKESVRRQGIGHALMEELFLRAKEKGISRLFLEVRERNKPAISYYESHGFLCAGRRPGFYSDPVEDALIYATMIR